MKKIILAIDGMTCSACSNGLEKYLNKQEGIKSASVNLVMANASIEYDEKILDVEKINQFIKKAGFESLGEFKEIKPENKNKKEKINFIIFTILAIIFMYISMGHMFNIPTIEFIDINKNPVNFAICLLIFAIAFIIYGFDIIKNGYKNLIHKVPNMDTLVSIGVLSSFLYSLYNLWLVINGNLDAIHNLYFEASGMIIYFVKLGRLIDKKSKDKTKEAIQKLVKITPENATIKIDGKEKKVTIDEVKKGDIVISKPGERISVDGEIIEGRAHLDESFITGESKPVNKKAPEKVIAGSINYDGYIEYKAEKIGKNSTISEIVKLVVEASNTKAPIAKIADTVSSYFVPIVILIAIITFIIYLVLGYSFAESLITFVTILVVACPCSLGLATPLAMVVSEGECAKSGILVKKSEILENAQKIDTIVFDKTGTLTYGNLKIAEIKNYSNLKDNELIQLVGSIEKKSTHPIARAFTDYLEEKNINYLDVKEFGNVSGYGVIGKVNSQRIIIGNSKILQSFNIENIHEKDEKELASKGNTIIYVVKDNKIIALIGVNDIIREDSKKVIEELNENGIDTIMLTGDNNETAKQIAESLKIKTVIANVLPKEKTEVIKKLKSQNKNVLMCGDGINDSPALATANIGVSIKSGTDIAMDSSDVILIQNNLNSILKLINISKKTIKIIKENLFWAFFYNVLMIPIAIGLLKPIGISINPMIASFAMVISSLTVILNTTRLNFKNSRYIKRSEL